MAARTMLFLTLLALTGSAFEPAFQRPAAAPAARPQAPAPAKPQPPGPTGARGARAGADPEAGPAVLDAEEISQEEGVVGFLPPLARRFEVAIPSIDLDTFGRTRPELSGITPSAAGFTLLLSDERDGFRGFVLLRLDADLELIRPAERIDPGASGRGQTDAQMAVSDAGGLGAVWLDVVERAETLRGRAWDSQGTGGSTWSLALPAARRDPEARDSASRAAPLGPEPALLWTENAWTLAVQFGGRMLLRDIDAASGVVLHEELLGRIAQVASSGALLARDSSGVRACAFDASGSSLLFLRRAKGTSVLTELGPGKIVGLAADASTPEGGWWILVRLRGRLVLRHLERSGAYDRDDLELTSQAWSAAELAVGPRGPCVLVQYAKGGLDALWVGDELPAPSVTRTELCGAERSVIAAHMAFRAERCAFVWTERRANQLDVILRSSAFGGADLSVERPLIDGAGSAVQYQPALAFAAERGVVAWTDQRSGGAVVGLRGLSTARRPGSGELFLPAEAGNASTDAVPVEVRERPAAKRPALALQPSGRALVAWIGAGASAAAVFAQRIDVDAEGELRATSKAIEIAARGVPTTFSPAVLALRSESGFVLAWVGSLAEGAANADAPSDDGRSEVLIAHVNSAGELDAAPRPAGSGSRLARPALAQLDDGRIVLSWDAQPHVNARRLAARVFSERLEPEQRELSFETMWHKSDYAAAIAPAAGGFALAWTSGEDENSDVFARLYDTDGRPLSRPLALSTRLACQRTPTLARASDGSFVALWQDNLSKQPRLVGRRFSSRGTQPGRCVRFSFGIETGSADFSNPVLMAQEDGRLLLVGEHSVVGKGREIGLCRVGSGWDEVEGR